MLHGRDTSTDALMLAFNVKTHKCAHISTPCDARLVCAEEQRSKEVTREWMR